MKVWGTPSARVETFAANSFVSACGDENSVYNFACNAGEEGKHYDVFTDDGRNLTKGILHYYHPCNTTHQASTKDEFISGYLVDNGGDDSLTGWLGRPYKQTKVIIWTDNGTNVHCTTNLDTKTWTTSKS